MIRYTLCMAIGLAGSLAFAQEQNYTVLGENATTAAVNLTGTTATRTAQANTTASAMIQRTFSQENFDKRWATEEKMYKDAGISEEKIAKIRELNQKMWDARAKGETADFQELSRQRREILTPEEVDKLRTARRAMIEERMGEGQTTETLNN